MPRAPTAPLAAALVLLASSPWCALPAAAARIGAPHRSGDDSEASAASSDEDDDAFLRSSFARHRGRVQFAGDEDGGGAGDDADDELLYHVRAGAVRIVGGGFELSSEEEALETAQRVVERPDDWEDSDDSDASSEQDSEVEPEAEDDDYDAPEAEADWGASSTSSGGSAEDPPPARRRARGPGLSARRDLHRRLRGAPHGEVPEVLPPRRQRADLAVARHPARRGRLRA